MSRSAAARRLGVRKKDAQVSLFPFLAVLICTMGALIVLLVVLVQQAKVQADEIAEERRAQTEQASRELEEQRIEQENHQWRLEVLQTQRSEIARQLADERLRLSHVEDHYRRLKAGLENLLQQAAELERMLAGGSQDADVVGAELLRVQQAIEAARRQLEQAKQTAGQQPRSFALIPYEGPHGTRRRPIYIECREDRVVLQPEGVSLYERDFDGPLGPGNPLDAALRATREYLARHGGVEQHGEPYPLLVVRSSGARSYAAAREAIESWDDEFGYELVDDDLSLNYPPPDPALTDLVQMAVDEARRRQDILRAAQPNRFEGGIASGFWASPHHGGFQAVGEAGGDGGVFGGSTSRGELESVIGERGGSPGETGDGDSPQSAEGAEAGGVKQPGGAPGGTAAAGQTLGSTTPFAASRGRNWGLKDAAAGATPYTRPIAVACFPDRLVIVPERATDQAPVVIPLEGATRSAVDPFVQSLWKRMDSWGLAGNRAYWKPVLRVEVAPGAERRFADLQQLLEGSGLVMERKSP
ncbi:MAG: hypothetical protein KY475_04115 [Planctomycetes bacterium]|nr:hypothetical protein [Planctomycetota bacterium]